MRTKGDITVFSDGTMNVYNRSLAEELWYDYKDFVHRAAKYRKMNKKDAELSAGVTNARQSLLCASFFAKFLTVGTIKGKKRDAFRQVRVKIYSLFFVPLLQLP